MMSMVVMMVMLMIVSMIVMVAILMIVSMAVMVVLLMIMSMAVMVVGVTQQIRLLDLIDFYMDMGSGDAALDGRSDLEPDAGNPDRVKLPHTFFFIGNNFQQGPSEHITRGSHAAFKI